MAEIDDIGMTIRDDNTGDMGGADRRCRGRPQLRPDDETRQIIYEAARREFAGNGYGATSMETVARGAGVSTKTLYRLVPNKAALFEGMVTDRLDRFVSEVNLEAIDHAEIDAALYAALLACTDLALDKEVIALQRMVLQETGKADLARTFYQNGMARNVAILADWLRTQQKRGLIALDNAEEAAGFLLGMVAFAPQRAAVFGGLPLPSKRQIEARVRNCVTLFLRGCQAAAKG
jgi:AcrR family transcriptional regulator